MLKSGDALVNAVTGERIVIRATAGETDGERFEAERFLLPEGPPHPEHIHPRQETVITIVRGVCGLKLDGNVRVAFPGERVVVPAGAPHQVWNAGGDTLHLHMEKRPGLESSERLLVALFELAAAGRTDARGMPSLLQQAAMIRAYQEAVRLVSPPWPVQRMLCALLDIVPASARPRRNPLAGRRGSHHRNRLEGRM